MKKYVKHLETGAVAEEGVGVSSLVFLLPSLPENILMRVTPKADYIVWSEGKAHAI